MIVGVCVRYTVAMASFPETLYPDLEPSDLRSAREIDPNIFDILSLHSAIDKFGSMIDTFNGYEEFIKQVLAFERNPTDTAPLELARTALATMANSIESLSRMIAHPKATQHLTPEQISKEKTNVELRKLLVSAFTRSLDAMIAGATSTPSINKSES